MNLIRSLGYVFKNKSKIKSVASEGEQEMNQITAD